MSYLFVALVTEFRATLLDKIDTEVEAITEMTVELEEMMDGCKLLVNTTVDECKTCATAECQLVMNAYYIAVF